MLVRLISLFAAFMIISACDARAGDVENIRGGSSCDFIADISKQMLCKAFTVAASDDGDCDEIADNSAKMICNAVSEASEGESGNKKAMRYCEKVSSDDDRALCYSSVLAVVSAASD